jgi:hypothetical protein
VPTTQQRSDLSELLTHWAFEPYQALDIAFELRYQIEGQECALASRVVCRDARLFFMRPSSKLSQVLTQGR